MWYSWYGTILIELIHIHETLFFSQFALIWSALILFVLIDALFKVFTGVPV